MSRLPPFITPRLHLSSIGSVDLLALQRHWTHPLVRRFLFDDRWLDTDAVAAIVARENEHARQEAAGLWCVEFLHESGLIGTVGLARMREDRPIELLCTLEPLYWGHGLATEAVQAVLRHAFEGLRLDAVQAHTDAGNERSRRLALRLGFERDATSAGSLGHFTLKRERWQVMRDLSNG
jgi:[ribosomal protein S5]-alanine N-acetyltransferase